MTEHLAVTAARTTRVRPTVTAASAPLDEAVNHSPECNCIGSDHGARPDLMQQRLSSQPDLERATAAGYGPPRLDNFSYSNRIIERALLPARDGTPAKGLRGPVSYCTICTFTWTLSDVFPTSAPRPQS